MKDKQSKGRKRADGCSPGQQESHPGCCWTSAPGICTLKASALGKTNKQKTPEVGAVNLGFFYFEKVNTLALQMPLP